MMRGLLRFHYCWVYWAVAWIAVVVLSLAPVSAAAQTQRVASIEGTTTDETAAVLPGVSVTLTSPALQVPQIVRVTDAEGRYRFRDLPPGVYALRYEMPGFQTVTREEVRLNAGFAATINITMKVGAIEESVTVTGQSPVVDVKTTGASTTFTNEILADAPVIQTMWQTLAMSPGIRFDSTPDVGGRTVGTQQSYSNYGTSDQVKPEIDGMDTREQSGSAGTYYDERAFEEVQVRGVGNDAEMGLPGTNYIGIVKSGGNEFHGNYFAAYESPRLQSNNVDDELRQQGVTEGNPLKNYWDISGDLGGRIIRDKLWFYGGVRNHRVSEYPIDFASDPGPDGEYLTPDDVQGEYLSDLKSFTGKLSWQPKETFKAFGMMFKNWKDLPSRGGGKYRPFEASYDFWFPTTTWKVEVQGTPSETILWNVLAGNHTQIAYYYPQEDQLVAGNPSRYDRTTRLYTGPHEQSRLRTHGRWMGTASLSIFPRESYGGEHSIKVGVRLTRDFFRQEQRDRSQTSGNYQLIYDDGVPDQIAVNNAPIGKGGSRMTEFSGFVKDTWRVNDRLTLNPGFRFERYHSFLPEQTKPQGQFGESGGFPYMDVLTWFSVAPRVGLAYDLTGEARTVIKATAGWYNHTMANSYANNFNVNERITWTYYWRDLDGNNDYTPGEVNLDVNGPDFVDVSGGEAAINNPDLKQPRTYEYSVGIDHELMADFSIRALYVYKEQVNLYRFVNVLRPLDVWNVPISRRDPGPDGVLGTPDDGGTITFYDYDPAYRGSDFVGDMPVNMPDGRSNTYHNIELTFNKRRSRNWDMLTSFMATKRNEWLNEVPETPNEDLFYPKNDTWIWNFKILGGYEFPYGIRTGIFLQVLSGDKLQRDYVFRRADPDGGPSLPSSGSITLPLEAYGSLTLPTMVVVNFRATKRFRFAGRYSLDVNFDVFNLTNANTATVMQDRSGPTYGAIEQILNPRIARFGVNFTF